MSYPKTHITLSKTIIILMLLAFSLSPCSVKRDVLDIFGIQHSGTLNKVKTTVPSAANCDSFFQNSSRTSVLKKDLKAKKTDFPSNLNLFLKRTGEEKALSNYSKTTTGNSPPKYILFKRLKLDLI